MRSALVLCLMVCLLGGCKPQKPATAVDPATAPAVVNPNDKSGPLPPRPEPVVVTPAAAPADAYGHWVVKAVAGVPELGPALSVKPGDPAWIGSQMTYGKDMMRLARAPRGLVRLGTSGADPMGVTNTCTKPTYTTLSNLDEAYAAKVQAALGMPPVKGRPVYGLQCNAPLTAQDGMLTQEEISGPITLHVYSDRQIVVEWGGLVLVLFDRAD